MLLGNFSTRNLLSQSEREYIAEGVGADLRADGRKCNEFRGFTLELAAVKQSLGSARVILSGTEAIVSISAEISRPTSLDRLNKGSLVFSVDTTSLTQQLSVDIPVGDRDTKELNGQIYNLLTSIFVESGCFNLEQLCILPGSHCWSLSVDVLILSFDGNLIDALCLASHAALASCRLPAVSIEMGGESTEISISNQPSESKALDIASLPLTVTLARVEGGETFLVDPSRREEICADCAIIFGFSRSGSMIFSQQMGSGLLSVPTLMNMAWGAQRLSQTMFQTFDQLIQPSQ